MTPECGESPFTSKDDAVTVLNLTNCFCLLLFRRVSLFAAVLFLSQSKMAASSPTILSKKLLPSAKWRLLYEHNSDENDLY